MRSALSVRVASRPALRVVSVIVGGVFVVVAVAGALAMPTRQDRTGVPNGVQIESLAAAMGLPLGPGESAAFLLRYRYAPGAHLDTPYAGPVLIAVESGTLTLSRVGNEVSVLYPAEVIEQPLTGEIISERQTGETLPIGGSADVGAGGSVYAPTGEIGPTQNSGDEPLVLLIVVLASEIRSGDDNSMVVEGTPPP